jgi:hypothetical protein
VNPSASSYSVGPDNRGCLTLTDNYYENTFTLHFSLGGINGGIASKGDIILFDNQSGTPIRGSGILRQQDPTAFSLSALAANYAFGVDGWDNSSGTLNHFALVGSFAQSGGNSSSYTFDSNDGGTIANTGGNQEMGSFISIQEPIAPLDGETYASLQLPGSADSANVTVYVINSSELFIVSQTTSGSPEFAGEAITAPSSFNSSSVSPNYILRMTGTSAGAASATIGIASFSGSLSGTTSGTLDEYASGTASTEQLKGNYSLQGGTGASGRLVIYGASAATSPVCYLTAPFDDVAAFCVSTDATASFGVLDAQPVTTYSNSSLAGNFFLGSKEPGDNTVPNLSAVAFISAGNLTGTQDASAPTGFSLGSAFTATLSVNANGAGNLGANTVAVTNGAQLFFINEANGAPAQVQVFEQ